MLKSGWLSFACALFVPRPKTGDFQNPFFAISGVVDVKMGLYVNVMQDWGGKHAEDGLDVVFHDEFFQLAFKEFQVLLVVDLITSELLSVLEINDLIS